MILNDINISNCFPAFVKIKQDAMLQLFLCVCIKRALTIISGTVNILRACGVTSDEAAYLHKKSMGG